MAPTSLMWKTVDKSALAKKRNDIEDELLAYFRTIVPAHVNVTVLADPRHQRPAIRSWTIGHARGTRRPS